MIQLADGLRSSEVIHGGWLGLGLRDLAARRDELTKRSRLRELTPVERSEGMNLVEAMLEMEAMERARWRILIEQIEAPLDIVRVQWDELANAGLSLRILNPDDLLEIRDAWPEWEPGPPRVRKAAAA